MIEISRIYFEFFSPKFRVTRFCSKSFFKILNKRAMKHKIWWYHWIPLWILIMIKSKNLFVTEKITKLWPLSRETSILTNWVWGLILGVYLFMSLRKKLFVFILFPTQNSMRNSVKASDFIFHHCTVEKMYKSKL